VVFALVSSNSEQLHFAGDGIQADRINGHSQIKCLTVEFVDSLGSSYSYYCLVTRERVCNQPGGLFKAAET
jgi:hypothetical protein